ncbi:serine/threonine-protein kinase EDR1 isoform X6 [Dendrobium catenatum]|uniref:serine/threonine-protein kinase EDR1 isoform X6 n=1 Tax=Dendrobium catenatum TaxID=906689 RepID=UPI00109F8E1B|nr:serine/threonine-protein kinase EDR1 isoform X6 [Dendrobium catenatum]
MEMPSDSGNSVSGTSNANCFPSDFVEKFPVVSLVSQEESLSTRLSACKEDKVEISSQVASQTLWSTGSLSGPIPNGFYSIIPDKKLKELFDAIPTPDDLYALGAEGLKADIILVDAEKDKKLSHLKQLSAALVKGLNNNPALLIKKIAGLVFDFYKRPNPELSPAKASVEDVSHLMENKGIQLLGQIRHGSCRPRAILFKVLADSVGLESKLMVGLPPDGGVECADSYKHISVVVMLNSVELLVDLMRFPGQLIPFSTKAIFISHIPVAGESDSAENDSCDSPLEPNSPLCGFSDRMDGEGASHSEPNIANAFWRCSRRKPVVEQQRTSVPNIHFLEHMDGPCLVVIGNHLRNMVQLDQDGSSTSEVRRLRRRSISITPEIGDDIVRAVRAMNETLKQNRLLRDHHDDRLGSCSVNENSSGPTKHKDGTGSTSTDFSVSLRLQTNSTQKAVSLPSSPHEFGGQDSERSDSSHFLRTEDFESTWNNVLQSHFLNKPLLPFEEWCIDFSELTVGTRVGIGFFGEVFRGIWNGTDVAIKVFLEQDLTTENMEDFCNEISILSRLRHPNVILFLGACMKPPHLSMVTEYMEMGSLYYLIHLSGQKKKLSWRRRLKMLRDICRGLMCIHRMKIVHRDLKSANCLVNKHWTVKICDFGLSRLTKDVPMKDESSAGTPEWMAPELIRNESITEKCDIFSLGVIMWELCTLNRPWEGVPAVQVVYAVANEGTRLEIPEGPLGKLIADCWAEPNQRPSCQEILTRLLDCEYAHC